MPPDRNCPNQQETKRLKPRFVRKVADRRLPAGIGRKISTTAPQSRSQQTWQLKKVDLHQNFHSKTLMATWFRCRIFEAKTSSFISIQEITLQDVPRKRADFAICKHKFRIQTLWYWESHPIAAHHTANLSISSICRSRCFVIQTDP